MNILQSVGRFLGEKLALVYEKLISHLGDKAIHRTSAEIRGDITPGDIPEEIARVAAVDAALDGKVDKVAGRELMPSPGSVPSAGRFLAETGVYAEVGDSCVVLDAVMDSDAAFTVSAAQLQEYYKRCMLDNKTGTEAFFRLAREDSGNVYHKVVSRQDERGIYALKAAEVQHPGEHEGSIREYVYTFRADRDTDKVVPGAGTVTETPFYLSAYTDARLGEKAAATDLTQHTENLDNPHRVGREQVGLGNADNTSDADKPVSTAARAALTAHNESGEAHADLRGAIEEARKGTPSATWQLSMPDGPVLKNSGGIFELKNSADGVYTGLITGDITIKGNVIQEGESFISQAQTVEVKDNTILLNRDEPGAGVTKGYAGIEIDRGSLPRYNIYFDESDDRFKAGQGENMWPILLRDKEADLIGGSTLIWDATNKRAKTGKDMDAELGKYLPLSGGCINGSLHIINGVLLMHGNSITGVGGISAIMPDGGAYQDDVNLISLQNKKLIHIGNDDIVIAFNTTESVRRGSDVIWDSGNDGAESGLDADLLDGKQGIEYALKTDIPIIRNLSLYTSGMGAGYLITGVDSHTINTRTMIDTDIPATIARTSQIPTTLPASDVKAWAKADTKPSYIWGEIGGKPTFAAVATSGSYNDLSNKPTIPTLGNYVTLDTAQTITGTKTFSAAVTGSAGFYDTSDRRLKENIKPIDLKPEKIKVYEFDKKERHSYGVIAQEVEAVYPSVVQEGEDGYKTVNYNEVLIIKCAELEAENQMLKNRLDRLEQLLLK